MSGPGGGDGLPGAVVACRPVDWSASPWSADFVARTEAKVAAQHPHLAEHHPLTGIYPDSVVRQCIACGIRVWVGPRSLVEVEAGRAMVGCHPCIAAAQGADLGAAGMRTLGNPDVPRPPSRPAPGPSSSSAFGGGL